MAENTLTANGSLEREWFGGIATIIGGNDTNSNFGGGTLTFQLSRNGGSTWIDIEDGAFQASFNKATNPIPQGKLRLNLTGATSPSLYVAILQPYND